MSKAHEYHGTPIDTVAHAKKWLREKARTAEGAICPCCTQMVKIYRRQINATMAHVLIRLYRADTRAPNRYHELKALMAGVDFRWGGDYGKLAYWNLIEPEKGRRDDGSKRTGYWRITQRGIDFVAGFITLPKYAHVFDGKVLEWDAAEQVNIRDCLGTRFDYNDLMQAV